MQREIGTRIVRSSLVFFLLLQAMGASFAADFHVRPSQDCLYNGDGSAAACATTGGAAGAFKGFASIDWTVIQPGDALYVIGRHTPVDADKPVLMINKSGTPTQQLIIRGDKPGFARGVIDGTASVNNCVRDNDNRYLTFLNMEIANCLQRGLHFDNGRGPNSIIYASGAVVSNVFIHDIVGGYQPTCIWGYGHGAIIQNSRLDKCGDDGIWWAGDQTQVINNQIADVGITPQDTGDCVQLTKSVGYLIKGNHCDHTAAYEKQCYNTASNYIPDGNAGGQIVENTCVMPRYSSAPIGCDLSLSGATCSPEGIAADQPKAIIARNFVTGGKFGIYAMGAGYIVGNVITQFSKNGIRVRGRSTQNTYVANNTLIADRGHVEPGTFLYCIGATDTIGSFFNNLIVGCDYAMEADVSASGNAAWINNSWDYNLIWQTTYEYKWFQITPAPPAPTNTLQLDPAFLGGDFTNPYSWIPGTSTSLLGKSVTSYSHPFDGGVNGLNPFRLDYNKDLRPDPPRVGAFEPRAQ